MELPKWGRVSLYTYGAPRVGNSEFAEFFEMLFAGREAYRIVNNKDVVARYPRSGKAAGAVLDYEHVGGFGITRVTFWALAAGIYQTAVKNK
mmetsp:Transcript_9846/g.25307  ORF Transcript_9846/g.25307 Transcript_9846/m.25307 type:complete len:92 (+) Transcript_9846:785-1060(+)